MRSIFVVVTSLALSSAACGDAALPLQPSAAIDQAAHSETATPIDPAVAEERADLAAVRRATAAFHDPAVAEAAGYTFGEPCQQGPTGAMGIHAPNQALVRDGIIDPLQPEILLYIPQPDGSLRLVGVEYMHFVSVRHRETGVVSLWRSPSRWTAEYEVANTTPELFGETFQGPMAGHTATMPWHWDLHVWLWAHNPDGQFAQYNPALSCGG